MADNDFGRGGGVPVAALVCDVCERGGLEEMVVLCFGVGSANDDRIS